ncbi:MAG: DUF362 domain-containing protein [Lentisphaerota bacterium]
MHNTVNNSAWIGSAERRPECVAAAIDAGLTAVGRLPASGERWVVKLNLTYPTYLPGVVNAPAFVEGLCQWASDRGVRLTLIEGDGGNGSYSAQDTFDGNGVSQIAEKYQANCVSISQIPWEWRETVVAGKTVKLPYSPFFRHRDFDRFVIAPLFKNHIFTTVTLGMKNLWGCIPDAYRMYYHHELDHGIVALCKELQPDFSLFDGLIAMRGRGPMEGHPLDMDAIMVSSNVGCGESAALEIMGISIKKVRHLQIAAEEGLLPACPVTWVSDPTPFKRTDFILERTLLNHLTIHLGKIPALQRVIYHSALSAFIYAIVNRMRGESAQTRLLKAKWSGKYSSLPRKD